MASLKDLVTLEVNNDECVILKVKDNAFMDLLSLGCFNGDEQYLRLTKGSTQTCTIFKKDGSHSNWSWGLSGHTLIAENVRKKGQMIQNCIENDFGIKVKKY